MSNELKPCPFCGGEATFAAHATAEEMDYGIICRTMAVIGCDACEFCMSGETDEETVAKWNARAAVTDEQFSLAVRDGRAWQVVRECEMLEVQTGDKTDYWDAVEIIWHCQSCHEERAVYGFGEDGGVWADKPKFCPNCGAKVVV